MAQPNLVAPHLLTARPGERSPHLVASFGFQIPPASTSVRGRRVQMYEADSWLPADNWCVSLTASWCCLKSGSL